MALKWVQNELSPSVSLFLPPPGSQERMAEGNKKMMDVAPSSLASGLSRASAAPCLSRPLGHTRSATDKSASLAVRPRSAQNNAAVDTQASELTTPPVVFYIDRQCLGRDCVSEQLATHLPE